MDRNQALWGVTAGGVCQEGGGVGVVREKDNHYSKTSTFGITRCDNFWPDLQLEVADSFHIR